MDAQELPNSLESFTPMIRNPIDFPRFEHFVISDSLENLHQQKENKTKELV